METPPNKKEQKKQKIRISALLIAALVIGIIIGYLINKVPTDEHKLVIRTTQIDAPIGYTEAIDAIDLFYQEAKNDPSLITKSFSASYSISQATITKILGTLPNPNDKIRFYPSLWVLPPGDATEKYHFSLILAKQDATGKMTFTKQTQATDNKIWEYIGPCPPDCPEDDFYTCAEWIAKFQTMGVNTAGVTCPPVQITK